MNDTNMSVVGFHCRTQCFWVLVILPVFFMKYKYETSMVKMIVMPGELQTSAQFTPGLVKSDFNRII